MFDIKKWYNEYKPECLWGTFDITPNMKTYPSNTMMSMSDLKDEYVNWLHSNIINDFNIKYNVIEVSYIQFKYESDLIAFKLACT